jgi:hypothetical protein
MQKLDTLKNTLRSFSEYDFCLLMTDSASCARFSGALIDESDFIDSHRTVYQSVSFWISGDYLLEIEANYFWSLKQAKSFVQELKLVIDDGGFNWQSSTYLRFVKSDGSPVEFEAKNGENYSWLQGDSVKVFKYNSSIDSSPTGNLADYEYQRIEQEEFCNLMSGAQFTLSANHAKLVAQLPIQYA